MGPPLSVRSVVDQNVIMRRIPVYICIIHFILSCMFVKISQHPIYIKPLHYKNLVQLSKYILLKCNQDFMHNWNVINVATSTDQTVHHQETSACKHKT